MCSGGILAAMIAAHLGATGGLDRLASLSLLVTMIDQAQAGTAGGPGRRGGRGRGDGDVRRKRLPRRAGLAEVFAWLRPNDLIWNYWVNNYLQGKPPPAFDILYWNADTTRMTAALHRDFVRWPWPTR